MNVTILTRLENAIRNRNPRTADALLPGVTEPEVKGVWDGADGDADLSALIALYGWHNGMSDAPSLGAGEGFFPGTGYRFLPLQAAAEHFHAMRAAAAELAEITQDPTGIAAGAGRYFPLFWDGATGYIAVDLSRTSNRGIVLIDFEAPEPYQQAYRTLHDFIVDAVRAVEMNKRLACQKCR